MSHARLSRLALCLALLCVFAGWPARALQLGETREQLLARHGAPGAEDHAKNLAAYFWEGWSAQLEFQDNAVRKLTYRRNWYLQDAEITSLLESNGGATHWRETSSASAPARRWTRDDGASATCVRVRPLSIVFQASGLAAAYQQGPKIVVPATPAAAYFKAPTFPKLLGSAPEPELPAVDPPPAPAVTLGHLPKLPAAELRSEPQPEPVVETSVTATPAPAPPAAEPTVVPVRENKPAPRSAAVPLPAPEPESHVISYILGSLGLLGMLAGGAFYFFRRQPGHGRTAGAGTRPIGSSSPIRGLDALRDDQVELFVGEFFRREGYAVELSAALNTDDGIDLMLRNGSETTLVQCKHWKSGRVSAREIREFYGAMAASGAPHGILVTTGDFTSDAREFAEGKGIDLLDGADVAAKIGEVAQPGENLCAVSGWIDEFTSHARVYDPECPVCHGAMVIRHNRANGTPSWSCRGYPRCPGRREPRLDLLRSATAH